MIHVYFAAPEPYWAEYQAPLRRALNESGITCTLTPDCTDPAKIDYLIYAPGGPVTDFSGFTRAKAILSLWAGVEKIVSNTTLTQPLARMVDNGLSEGMREWVTGHVLRHHLGMDALINGQDGIWRQDSVPPLARNRTVGILGLGALGHSCAEALATLNFKITGWSRSPKDITGMTCHSGDTGLTAVLSHAEILVLLLPQTKATQHIINAQSLAQMPKGAVIINPGRGPLIDDTALLAALNSGQISHATLDVFDVEPLPSDHPFWAHRSVTVTPHIASQTRADTASAMIAENIKRCENGKTLMHVVDRDAGY